MIRLTVLIMLLVFLAVPLVTTAQEDGCDLEFLADDFLHHWEIARSAEERLSLLFEYLTFVLICQDTPDCTDLQARYAERIAQAENQTDLLLANADLTADLMVCGMGQGKYSNEALAAIFAELDQTCTVDLMAEMDFVHAECSGSNDQATAEAMLAAVQDYVGSTTIYFDLILDDGVSVTSYAFTGDRWIVAPKEE